VETFQGRARFHKLVGRLKELPLRSLRILGTLDVGSLARLQRLFMNPVVGRILRSQLQKLDLPMRTPQDTIHARNYRREDKTDGVCDCNALIRFKSSEQETKEKVFEIGAIGLRDTVENPSFGTPHRMIRSTYRALGFSPHYLDALLLFGKHPDPIHRVYANPFVGYGLYFPKDPLHLTELVLDAFDLDEIAPTLVTSFVVTSL
jgi:hypothetical protein